MKHQISSPHAERIQRSNNRTFFFYIMNDKYRDDIGQQNEDDHTEYDTGGNIDLLVIHRCKCSYVFVAFYKTFHIRKAGVDILEVVIGSLFQVTYALFQFFCSIFGFLHTIGILFYTIFIRLQRLQFIQRIGQRKCHHPIFIVYDFPDLALKIVFCQCDIKAIFLQ